MIYVDVNEQAMCDIPARLKAIGLPVVIAPAKEGAPHFDYVASNADGSSMIGVERKTVADYFQSMISPEHHLNNQLVEYSACFDLSFLAIIGDIQEYMVENGISNDQFIGNYLSVMTKVSANGKQGEIKVAELIDNAHFTLFMKKLHDIVQEGNFVRLPKFNRAKASDDDIAVNVLTGFRNIGATKAQDILKQNTTLENSLMAIIVNGSFNTKGLGEKTETDAKNVLKHRYGGTAK